MGSSITVALYLFAKVGGELYILCSRRGSTAPVAPGLYNVPTGHPNEGESLLQAALRELYEETNIVIPTAVALPSRHSKNFGAFITSLPIPTNGDHENEDTHWELISNIDSLEFAFGQAHSIKKFSKYINND